MNKFAKSLGQMELIPLREEECVDASSLATAGDDPLVFIVKTSDGLLHVIDLTRYRDGSGEFGIIGSPEMIACLAPVIMKRIGNEKRSRKAINSLLYKNIKPIFDWITWISIEIGPEYAPKTASDITSEDGAILKRYLVSRGGNLRQRRKVFTAILGIFVEARLPNDAQLFWPTIAVDRERHAHVDVDPDAVKYLYHACKRVIDAARRNQERGKIWLQTGIDPRNDPNPRRLRSQPGFRGAPKNPVWYNHANLAVLARANIESYVVLGQADLDSRTYTKIKKHTSPGSPGFSGVTLPDLYAAIAPTPLEIAASILIVSMETGWIDTVDNIDLTSEWFVLRRGLDIDVVRKLDSVVLRAVRPKTGRIVTAVGQAGPRFRAFQIIMWLQERSKFLREALNRRRATLEAHPETLAVRQELAVIDRKLRSPWLYYSEGGRGSSATGNEGLSTFIFAQLKHLKRIAVNLVPICRPHREKSIKAIEALRWSDLRDAFATYVYDNSGQNIFLVQRALSHASPITARHYLQQRRQLRQRFDAFRTVLETALQEVLDDRPVDPTILYLACNFRDFGDADRIRLRRHRTRMGMGCANPTNPETFLAPSHPAGAVCAVQRCVLCRHGIIFAESFEHLADRHADLLWLRETTLPNRWMTSTFWWEFEALKLLLTNVFLEKQAAFIDRSNKRLAELRVGRCFLFDDPEVARGVG